MPHAGKQLDDITLIRRIATGGMAELWEGKQKGIASFERRVAVKLILPHLAKEEDFIRLFFDEAYLASQLNHTNICQIHKLGVTDSIYYIAMEYIEGINVMRLQRQILKRKTLLPIELACQIAIGMCAALEYAHNKTDAKGQPLHIIHRDLSPPNVMITFDGHVKIIDFGIAKAKSQLHNTPADTMRGKFSYMSPEYVFDDAMDARSDIFSLGIVLWELLTGKKLFNADNEYAKMARISRGNYTPPDFHRSNIPVELVEITMKALAFNKEDRYASCAELQESLEHFVYEQQMSLSPRRLANYLAWLDNNGPTPLPIDSMRKTSPPLSRVPAHQPPRPQVKPVIRPKPQALSDPKRILIADDHKQIRDTLEMVLSTQGYQVTTAQDGLEAIQHIERSRFDICLLDLDMPKLNGREVLQQVRSYQPSLPCIIQTAEDSVQTATELGRIGALFYLVKPIKVHALLRSIDSALQTFPQGEDLEQLIYNQYPTPIASLHSQVHRLHTTETNAKIRHALLAAKFELFSVLIGGVALSQWLHDHPQISHDLAPLCSAQMAQPFTPHFWHTITQHISQLYKNSEQTFFSRSIRDLLSFTECSSGDIETHVQPMLDMLADVLGHSCQGKEGSPPQKALKSLALYHQDIWKNNALFSDPEIEGWSEKIEPFLLFLDQRMHRMIDFDIIYVDAVEDSNEGHRHYLTVLRGLTTTRRTQLMQTPLQTRKLYLFTRQQKPLFSLFPFFVYDAKPDQAGKEGLGVLVQVSSTFQPLYRNVQTGYLIRLEGNQLEQATNTLRYLFTAEQVQENQDVSQHTTHHSVSG